MARSDLLIALVHAATKGDSGLLRRAVEALIAEERGKQHHVLADRLEAQLRETGVKTPGIVPLEDRAQSLVHEVVPRRQLHDLILPELVTKAIGELVEEHHRVELLRAYNLEPRNRVLLVGPPGNGKTSLAEALATSLVVPLFVVRYEGIIGSYLGETALRLLRLFEYISTRHAVLFFDEFDTIGKERGDTHETGEIKRVVSSLLMQVDSLPPHVIVVTATNHRELLDRAVWRRFQLRLALPKPEIPQIEQWLSRFEDDFEPLPMPRTILAHKLVGLSFAEIEEFGLDIKRRWVLDLPDGHLKRILADRLHLWHARALTRRKPETAQRNG